MNLDREKQGAFNVHRFTKKNTYISSIKTNTALEKSLTKFLTGFIMLLK